MFNVNPYDKTAAAIWPDVMDWLVSHHQKDITQLYEKLFTTYLSEKFGKLSPDAKKRLIRGLMQNIITDK